MAPEIGWRPTVSTSVPATDQLFVGCGGGVGVVGVDGVDGCGALPPLPQEITATSALAISVQSCRRRPTHSPGGAPRTTRSPPAERAVWVAPSGR